MTIAVVGAGPIGLATLKNLREEGFEVTAFEKAPTIGGVWKFNPDPHVTSVLETTISNTSRFKNCFTDFPVSDNLPAMLTAGQVCEYLDAYATYFKLHKHIELDTNVQKVVRNTDDTKWQLHLVKDKIDTKIVEYDKVVFCTGTLQQPFMPSLEGSELFKGNMIHSQAFKRPEEFKGLKVLIVGLGNTAVDISTSLIVYANKIHVAHRRGVHIFPRHCLGKPVDLHLRRRGEQLKNAIAAFMPATATKMQDDFLKGITKEVFGEMKPEWNIHPPPSIKSHHPVVSDNFIDSLKDGSVISHPGLRAFTGEKEVELLDGARLQVDAIIFCTGYEADFSIMPDLDPTHAAPTEENKSLKAKVDSGSMARLYQNIFEPTYPDSIAYFSYWSFTVAAIPIGDLLSMALAQIWKGGYKLPPKVDMNKEIDKHHAWVIKLAEEDGVYGNIVQEGPWQHFLHEAAGTGCNQELGYGIRGWLFWLKNLQWCNMLMTGVDSPHLWRLFDGRRKKWDGAKAAILKANEDAKKFIDEP